MTGSHPTVTDDLIRRALTELADGPDAEQLQDDVLRAVDIMPQARASWLGFGSRRTAFILVVALLMATLAGAVAIGSLVLRPQPMVRTTDFSLAYGLDGDIFVSDWDGRNAVRIADGLAGSGPTQCRGFWGEGPIWSPDGQHLAYRSVWGSCAGTVFISDPDGDVVASFPGTGWLVAWSPDSTRVATWVELSQTIGVYGLDGVRQALLTLPPGLGPPGDYDPVWSPDGASLLIRLAPPMPSQVWELPVDGRTARRVPADDTRSQIEAVYSHDGARVAFVPYFESYSLVIAEADGTELRVLPGALSSAYYGPDDGEYHGDPVWSTSGDRVAFSWSLFDRAQNVFGPVPSAFELRVVDVSSGKVTTLAAGREIAPISFSPEGDRILFRYTSDNDSLWSVNTDGSGARLLVEGTHWGDWQ